MLSSNISSRYKYYLLLLPVILAAIIYFPCLKNGWWTVDDTIILNLTIENGWHKFFYKKEVWHQISSTNLTPWINLSYAIDWFLFGFNPKGFFYHHYFSFLLAIFLCELVIYRTLGLATALASLLLFVITIPAAMVASFLWLRHYVEGLLFAALAFLFFLKSYKKKSWYYSLLGAFFYFLACAAKEIYVPLILLIVFHPNSLSRENFRFKSSYLFVALIYILWRYYMLNFNSLTIYSPNPSFVGSRFFYLLFYGLYLHNILSYIVLFLFILLLIINFLKWSRFLKFYFLIVFIGVLFPITIASPFLLQIKNDLASSRILVLFSLFLSCFFSSSFFFNKLPKFASSLLLSLLLFVNLYVFHSNNPLTFANCLYDKHKKLGTFLLSKTENDVLVAPDLSTYFLRHLLSLNKKTSLNKKHSPIICSDACLCERYLKNSNINFYFFDGDKIIKQKSFSCSIKNDLKPSLHIKYDKGRIFWEMGPLKRGKYCILVLEDALPKRRYCLPYKGSVPFAIYGDILLLVKYISPEGWSAYSDIYHFRFSKSECRLIHKSPFEF